MGLFLIAAVASLAGAGPDEPLLEPEVSAGVGALGIGFTHAAGRTGDFFLVPAAEGRALFGGFAVEGSLAVAAPTLPDGPATSVTAQLRLGYSWHRFALLAGPSAQYIGIGPSRVQWLPTARARLGFEGWAIAAGIFDDHAVAPATLSVEIGQFGLGYVAPVGALAQARFHLGNRLDLLVRALAFRLFNTETAFVTVSTRFGGTR
jgi:hypothetical protein